jgi:dUTP pyrophosphatase
MIYEKSLVSLGHYSDSFDNMNSLCNYNITPTQPVISEDYQNLDTIVKILPTSPDFKMPTKADLGSSGYDVYSVEKLTILPDEIKAVDVGFKMELELNWECQIRSRSGMGFKYGITNILGIGTLDSSYRGQVKVGLINHSKVPYEIAKGDRVGQIVIHQVPQVKLKLVDSLTDTNRGSNGFGSTGK